MARKLTAKSRKLRIEYLELGKIKRQPHNAKEHDLGALMQSFERFGYVAPMILNEQSGRLLAGHGRLDELLMLKEDGQPPPEGVRVEDGKWLAPVVMGVRLSDKEGQAYTVADNRMVELGGWDEPQLLDNLMMLSKNGGLDGVGYDQEDTDRLFQLLHPEIQDAEVTDEAEELQRKWDTESGQLWQIGRHRLLCGDATSAEDVERLLNGAVPNLMVTDPPYGVEYDPNWRNEAAAKGQLSYAASRVGEVSNDDRIDWSEAYLLFPGNVAYTWSPGGNHVIVTGQAVQVAGFEIRAMLIWQKPHIPISRGHYAYRHEPVWYAVRKGKAASWIGPRMQGSVWKIALDENISGGHSTQKPIECMARPIRNHSGDVYDPFIGSGTTMVAADQLNRACYGMDIEPKYVAVTLERMSKLGIDPKRLT